MCDKGFSSRATTLLANQLGSFRRSVAWRKRVSQSLSKWYCGIEVDCFDGKHRDRAKHEKMLQLQIAPH